MKQMRLAYLGAITICVIAILSATYINGADLVEDGDDRIIYEVIPPQEYEFEDETAHYARNVDSQCAGDIAAMYLADACGKPACAYMHYVVKPALVNKNSPICADAYNPDQPQRVSQTLSTAIVGPSRAKGVVYFLGADRANIYKINPITGATSVFFKTAPTPYASLALNVEVVDGITYLVLLTSGDLWQLNLAANPLHWEIDIDLYSQLGGAGLYGPPGPQSRIAFAPANATSGLTSLYYIAGDTGNPTSPYMFAALTRGREGNAPVYGVSIPIAQLSEFPKFTWWNNKLQKLFFVDVKNVLWSVDPRVTYDARGGQQAPITNATQILTLPFGSLGAVAFGSNADATGLLSNTLYIASAQKIVAVDLLKKPSAGILWTRVLNGTNVWGTMNNIW